MFIKSKFTEDKISVSKIIKQVICDIERILMHIYFLIEFLELERFNILNEINTDF